MGLGAAKVEVEVVVLDLALLSQVVLLEPRAPARSLSSHRPRCGLLGQLDARLLRTAGALSSVSVPVPFGFHGLVLSAGFFTGCAGFCLMTLVVGILTQDKASGSGTGF